MIVELLAEYIEQREILEKVEKSETIATILQYCIDRELLQSGKAINAMQSC